MAADIGQELYEQIRKRFEEKYKKAQLFGNPISDTLKKLETGEATFRDADIYAVEVGTMLSDSMVEVLKLEELPNETMYYNIAKKTIEPSLQTGYNLVSNVASAIQDDYNRKIGTGLKAAVPEYDTYRSDNIIEGAVKAKTQESLNAALQEPVETFTRAVVDNTKKKNAEIHSKAGLEVKVTRIYDHVGLRRRTKHAEACSWCKERCGTDVSYKKAYAMGMFQRHNGCGCLIEYTSAKGEKTYSNSKYGWSTENTEREQRIEKEKQISEEDGIKDLKRMWRLSASGSKKNQEITRIDIGSVDIDKRQEATDYFRNQIRNLENENAIVITKKGKVIRYIGTPETVMLDDEPLDGAIVLHNHPISNGILSFGKDDYELIKNNQTAIFELCNAKYDYRLEVIKPLDDISYGSLSKFVRADIETLSDLNEDYQHLLMEGLRESGYIKYYRKPAGKA